MDFNKLIDFYSEINQLKSTLRFVAKKNKADKKLIESTADHSWRVAFMAIDLHQKFNFNLDIMRVAKMALIHDLCECNMNEDIDCLDVKLGMLSEKEKHSIEEQAMKNITKKSSRDDIYQLWFEYLNQETKEAKYVKLIDKFESSLHMVDRDAKIIDYEFTATFCDKAIYNFLELAPFYNMLKKKLKEHYLKKGYPWNEEWDSKLKEEVSADT